MGARDAPSFDFVIAPCLDGEFDPNVLSIWKREMAAPSFGGRAAGAWSSAARSRGFSASCGGGYGKRQQTVTTVQPAAGGSGQQRPARYVRSAMRGAGASAAAGISHANGGSYQQQRWPAHPPPDSRASGSSEGARNGHGNAGSDAQRW